MKHLLLLLSILLLMTSCDLSKLPEGSISTDRALTSVNDALKFRADMYLCIRDYLSSGYPIYLQELMADSFHASITFGNRNGEYYKWEITSNFGYVENIWNNSYYNVTLANFLEQGIAKLIETDSNLTEEDKAKLDVILGEAAFLKAFSMFVCTQLYCNNYDASTANSDMGLMLLDEPVPSPSDISTYVGRSSLADTYAYIDKNISIAESKLAVVEPSVGSIYITRDAVIALKARIALFKGDYDIAIASSTLLVEGGKYPLIDNMEEFNDLWINDSGKECIVQYWAGYDEGSLPNSNDYDYIKKNSNGTYSPNYIPEQWIIDSYDKNDIRFNTWFKKLPVTYGTISGDVYVLFKFPGNPALRSGTATLSNYINKIKAFRIAEQYLIAAEAYASKGQDANACRYLNALRTKRIPEYIDKNYTGEQLMNQIKSERVKELFGEGFRFTDLKRWKIGFKRSSAQDNQIITNAGGSNTEFLSKEANDYHWLWPIPQAEMDSNPNIKGQQNPGY